MTHTAGVWALWLALCGEAAFLLLFGLRSRWWASWVGRFLMLFSSLWALLLLLAAVAPWFGSPRWLQLLGLGAFFGLAGATWWRVAWLLWTQHHERQMSPEGERLLLLERAILSPDVSLDLLREMVTDGR